MQRIPDQLSLSATMPRFKEMERAHRSIILSMVSEQRRRARNREAGSGARWSLFVTLAGGMQELVDRIANRLPEGCVRSNTPVATTYPGHGQETLEGYRPAGTKALKWTLWFSQLLRLQTADILERRCSVTLPMNLKQITYASTATVSLAFRKKTFPARWIASASSSRQSSQEISWPALSAV